MQLPTILGHDKFENGMLEQSNHVSAFRFVFEDIMKQMRKSIWLAPVATTLATLFLLKCVFLIGYVPTGSMEPTIKQGSYIIGLRVYGELNQGDIIIFHHEGRLLVKRIAAVAGESVRWGEATLCVPEGEFYVLGDNPGNSNDSRYWEDPFVAVGNVMGKLVMSLPTVRFIAGADRKLILGSCVIKLEIENLFQVEQEFICLCCVQER